LPEQPEVRIMSDFINTEIRQCDVLKIEKSPISKNKCDLSVLEGKPWKVESSFRGKEMMLRFSNDDDHHNLKVNFAKIASVETFEIDTEDPLFDRRAMLRMYTSDKIYAISDFTRFVMWRWSDEWDNNRSPDIVTQHNDWRDHLYASRKSPYFKRPIFDLLTDQRFFNGIGNFSRCEILCRTRFSPFTPLSEILSSDILRDDFFTVTREVLNEIASLGGLQFQYWKNPFGTSNKKFNKWVRCYNKPKKSYYMKDSKGTKFWFEKKWSPDYAEWAKTHEVQDTTLLEKIYRKIKL
jgi:endonuclease VIII-like 1